MINAKNLFLAVILFFFSLNSLATTHSTSFDERPICEKSKGVWREFGNLCVDDCEHVFNKYKICPNSITFGCDCGEGRCWLDNKCIEVADYKKSYDKKIAEEKDEEEVKRKDRDEKIKNNPQLRAYLYDIYKHNQNSQQQTAQTNPQGNQNNNQSAQQIPTQPIQKITQVPPAVPQTGQTAITRQVPPAFIAQEQQKQQQQPVGVTPLLQDPKTGETIQLPVVPLPQ